MIINRKQINRKKGFNKRIKTLLGLFVFVFFLVWIIPPATAADSNFTVASQALLRKYQAIQLNLDSNNLHAPLFMESTIKRNTAKGDVYALLNYPYDQVVATLQVAQNWCGIAILHVNIKSCVAGTDGDESSQLSFYVGTKEYQTPAEAFKLRYDYRLKALSDDYLDVSLTAGQGPLGTQDYLIELEGVPIDRHTTFIHFKYSYGFGFVAKLAMDTYLATLGRNKVGFTIKGRDNSGLPVYVAGIKGVIERNSMRYFLAIKAYLDALKLPREQRFEARLNEWFDYTQKFKRQLFELEKNDYLAAKRKEDTNQLALQTADDRGD